MIIEKDIRNDLCIYEFIISLWYFSRHRQNSFHDVTCQKLTSVLNWLCRNSSFIKVFFKNMFLGGTFLKILSLWPKMGINVQKNEILWLPILLVAQKGDMLADHRNGGKNIFSCISWVCVVTRMWVIFVKKLGQSRWRLTISTQLCSAIRLGPLQNIYVTDWVFIRATVSLVNNQIRYLGPGFCIGLGQFLLIAEVVGLYTILWLSVVLYWMDMTAAETAIQHSGLGKARRDWHSQSYLSRIRAIQINSRAISSGGHLEMMIMPCVFSWRFMDKPHTFV